MRAALLGFLIGWVLRAIVCQKKIADRFTVTTT